MSKTSDRAHIEKNLEEMMGDDWRVFRARLVAQERVEQETSNATPSASSRPTTENSNDKQLTKQGQLGDLFAGAISSIFNHSVKNNKQDDASIFNGDNIGGANGISVREDELLYQDPFVSHEELPILMKPKSVKIDKHRWAHSVPHVEPGCVLIANEKLGGVFHQTVVLIIDHHESTGSTGIVINRYVQFGSDKGSPLVVVLTFLVMFDVY
jgi:putative transcriptional regulator